MTKNTMNLRKGLVGLVGAVTLASTVNSNADLLQLKMERNPGSDPFIAIQHISGATEVGFDGFDSANLFSGDVDFYSDSYTQLDRNALPANSLTAVTNKVYGVGMESPTAFNLKTTIFPENGEFNGKVLNLDIYNISNGVPVFQGTYDARNTTNLANSVPLTVTNGHSYNIVFRPTIPINPPTATNTLSVGNKVDARTGSFNVGNGATNVCVIGNIPGLSITNGIEFTYQPQGISTNHNLQFYAMGVGGFSTTNSFQLGDTNRPPVAFNVTNNVDASGSVSIGLNGYDPDYPVDTLSYSVNTVPIKGSLEGIVGTNVLYTAKNNEFGNETLIYSVTDGEITNSAQINLTVNNVDRPSSFTNYIKINEHTLNLNSRVQPNRYVEFLKSEDLSDTNSWQVITGLMVPNSTNDYVGLSFNDYNATNSKAFYNLRQRLAP